MVLPLILGSALAGSVATGAFLSDEENRLKDATEGVFAGIGTGAIVGVKGFVGGLQAEFNENGVAMVAGLTMVAIGVASYHLILSILRS